MEVPADRVTRTAAPASQAVGRGRRRRPTGEPPPLPHHLQTSGVRWLVATVVLMVATVAVFGRGVRGLAVDVTVADVAVVQWLGGIDLPGFRGLRGAGRISLVCPEVVPTCWSRLLPCGGSAAFMADLSTCWP